MGGSSGRTASHYEDDAPELTPAQAKRARAAADVPGLLSAVRRARCAQKAPVKEKVTIRLDADVVAHFRATGPGWQTRLNAALRRVLDRAG